MSVETQINLYPFISAANAKPIPVLPDVPSTIVPPGFNLPSFSASSIILIAILSFTELPGLKYSTLANTKASISAVILFNLTNGVFPIVSNMFFEYFIKILNRVIRSERFYKSKKCFDYIFDTKDNGYLPFEKSLANLYSLQLVLIQNGGRVNLSEYGYIRCNFFLGWAPIYKEIVVGKITCEEYFAIGSANLSKLNQELIYSKYTQYLGVYDLLIVEQVSLTNKLTNHINHKQFMDKIVEYKSNNPDKNIAYICRVDRETITGKFKTIIEQNDKILKMNNIVKIERQFCEIVIKKSKAIIAIDSSIRIEFCLLGKKFLSLQPTYSNNDWPSILFPDSLSLFSEEQSVFDNKLNSIINASHDVNLNFLNSKYALENFIKKVT